MLGTEKTSAIVDRQPSQKSAFYEPLLIQTKGAIQATIRYNHDGKHFISQCRFFSRIKQIVEERRKNRWRRYQEYRADEYALRSTGKVQAFKDAMTRLTNMNMLVATSTRRARHPTSHPTLLKRLRHADEFAARSAAPAGLIQA